MMQEDSVLTDQVCGVAVAFLAGCLNRAVLSASRAKFSFGE